MKCRRGRHIKPLPQRATFLVKRADAPSPTPPPERPPLPQTEHIPIPRFSRMKEFDTVGGPGDECLSVILPSAMKSPKAWQGFRVRVLKRRLAACVHSWPQRLSLA